MLTDLADNISVVVDRDEAADVLNALYKKNYLITKFRQV
jgi:hypothetical protein